MLTFLPLEQIDEMDKWEGSQLNKAKEILAFELTKLVHGEEEAQKAQESARALFSQGNADNMPTTELEEADFQDGKIDILEVLVKSGQASSRSDARRAVTQGSVSVDGEKVTDITTTYAPADFDGGEVRRGKQAPGSILPLRGQRGGQDKEHLRGPRPPEHLPGDKLPGGKRHFL